MLKAISNWHYLDVFSVTFIALLWMMAMVNTAYNYVERDCQAIAPAKANWAIPKTPEEVKQLQLAPLLSY